VAVSKNGAGEVGFFLWQTFRQPISAKAFDSWRENQFQTDT
jgi:hypothetical protein